MMFYGTFDVCEWFTPVLYCWEFLDQKVLIPSMNDTSSDVLSVYPWITLSNSSPNFNKEYYKLTTQLLAHKLDLWADIFGSCYTSINFKMLVANLSHLIFLGWKKIGCQNFFMICYLIRVARHLHFLSAHYACFS